ncbi:hypothetical protein Syun_028306 [Stephania yunnanensis]|uniref:Uncharacterized protein n=1 Tax=Stephania yunnanensis TaxID=152371 RepID=A0AAP0EJM8_9MAGN
MIDRQQLIHRFNSSSTPTHQAKTTLIMDGHHDQYHHKPMSMVMIMITSSKNSLKRALSFSSAFFYFSLFIIFFSLSHVPPSTLFKDTKFWFLLSNAIILVVAADSGAFSSSDKVTKHDVYEEVLINSRAARPPSPLDSHLHKVGKELALISSPSDSEQSIFKGNNNALVLVGDDPCQDVHQDQVSISNVSVEKVITVVPSSDDQDKTIISSSPKNNILRRSKTEKLGTTPMEYLESCEDMSIVPTSDHPQFRGLRRSKTENLENKGAKESAGCDEFSAMSVEELNKRVEEFINKFNREIRLQETKNYLCDQILGNDHEEEY